MVEAASVDKQTHAMDTERWLLDMIEFDRAIAVAKTFAEANPDTIVIVTADHECGGASIIGASTVTDAVLQTKSGSDLQGIVGTYQAAKFPRYTKDADGYPVETNIDYRMLIGYGANADRYEDWRTNEQPILTLDQQPFGAISPLSGYPAVNATDPTVGSLGRPIRDVAGDFLIRGPVPGTLAAHTGADVPLSAFGAGDDLYHGTIDNTDVFFKLMQAMVGTGVKP
jgi:alkaline phosphatase